MQEEAKIPENEDEDEAWPVSEDEAKTTHPEGHTGGLGQDDKGEFLLNLLSSMVLDGDPEGKKAAQKAADALTVRGHRVRITELPDGADPNEVLAS